jgi:hypothetical protein
MLKTAQYALAAALLAGSSTFALAQGEPPKGGDAMPPAAVKQQPGETKSAPTTGMNAPAPSGHKQVQTPTNPSAQGTQTGTARETASPGANPKATTNVPATGMKTQPTGMPTTPSNAGTQTGTAPDPAGPGAERKQ